MKNLIVRLYKYLLFFFNDWRSKYLKPENSFLRQLCFQLTEIRSVYIDKGFEKTQSFQDLESCLVLLDRVLESDYLDEDQIDLELHEQLRVIRDEDIRLIYDLLRINNDNWFLVTSLRD